MPLFYRCIVAGVLLMVVACSPNETRPEKASTLCFLVDYCGLGDYLNDRRRYLNSMKEVIALLDDDLLTSQVALSKLKKQLDKVELPTKQLEQLKRESKELQADADRLSFQIIESQERIEKYNNDIVTTDSEMKSEVASLRIEKKKVDSMQKKLDRVRVGIKRIAALTLKYSEANTLIIKVAGLNTQPWVMGDSGPSLNV